MNRIINKFLLTVEKFLQEMHLKQSGSTYSAYGPFTDHRERIQKVRETGIHRTYKLKDLNGEKLIGSFYEK